MRSRGGHSQRSLFCMIDQPPIVIGRKLILRSGLLVFFTGLLGSLFVRRIDRIIADWGKPGKIGEDLSSWPTDFSRDINPIPCHSHNDYWRLVPLYNAISAGCIGVEADIWLYDEELYVGHSVASLTKNRTLNSLYISPLLDIISRQNPKTPFHSELGVGRPAGVFDTVPTQSLVLLLDFKTSGEALWPYVQSALQPFRERNYLTRVNGTQIIQGAITIVGTGNTPFNLISSSDSNPHQDIFFDAPLHELGSSNSKGAKAMNRNATYTSFNSYFASTSFQTVFGRLVNNRFSDAQLAILRAQISGAQSKGLKARYWEIPHWPIGLRNHVWEVLVQEGIDLLNVDDLKSASRLDWRLKKPWWARSW